jgi:hypothetical protein
MKIISLVSLVIISLIVFLVFSTTPSKIEKFEEKKADLVIDHDEFINFKKFEDREPTYAKYGSESKKYDVTQIIKNKYEIWKSNRFRVTNDNMGGDDPDPGVVKTLRIWYNDSNHNNNNVDLRIQENEFINFESFDKEPKYANYGSEYEGKVMNNNVTQIIKNKYESWKANRFRVTNDNMGVSLNRNDEKKLRIWF